MSVTILKFFVIPFSLLLSASSSIDDDVGKSGWYDSKCSTYGSTVSGILISANARSLSLFFSIASPHKPS